MQYQCVHEYMLKGKKFIPNYWSIYYHSRKTLTRSFNIGDYKNPQTLHTSEDQINLLSLADIGLEDQAITDISNSPSCDVVPHAKIPLNSSQTESPQPSSIMKKPAQILSHSDFMAVANSLSAHCRRNHTFGKTVSG